jgi:hypothetical protein
MTCASKKTRGTSARAREIKLIKKRLAMLSELESTLERDNATLLAPRARRAAILLHSFGGGPWQSKIGRASCRPLAVRLLTKVVDRGLTKSP